MLEADPLAYPDARFMARVSGGTLVHVDLLADLGATRLTPVGEAYFGVPAGFGP